MKSAHKLSFILLVVGGLNWGLVGLFDYNLVSMLFGGYPMLEQIIYVLVGFAALYMMLTHKKNCKVCSKM